MSVSMFRGRHSIGAVLVILPVMFSRYNLFLNYWINENVLTANHRILLSIGGLIYQTHSVSVIISDCMLLRFHFRDLLSMACSHHSMLTPCLDWIYSALNHVILKFKHILREITYDFEERRLRTLKLYSFFQYWRRIWRAAITEMAW